MDDGNMKAKEMEKSDSERATGDVPRGQLDAIKKENARRAVEKRQQVLKNAISKSKDNYETNKKLGEGGFGAVFLATEKDSGEKYAVKIISKGRMVKEDDVAAVQAEITIMEHLNGHSNIVTLSGAFEDEDNVYVVLELCEGGDMFQRLLAKGRYSEKDAAELCRTMLEILAYCHEKDIVHRDLKPENFLFDGPGDDARLKATDFGLSTFVPKNGKVKKACGTPIYIAPEVIKGEYDQKADIWSVGVILYILLSGKVPFFGKTTDEMLNATLCGKYHFNDKAWKCISDEAKNAVSRLLTYESAERPSARELLGDPWIKKDGTASSTPLIDSVFENLKEFSEMNKLKKRALQLMASNIKIEQHQHIREAFERVDEDKSGTITIDEMRKVVERFNLGLSDDEFRELWSTYDVDGNGEIDYIEFLTATTELNKLQTIENLQHAFTQFDKDGDGQITVQEVMESMKDLGVDEATATKMLAEADSNRDGVIDYTEFVAMMTTNGGLNPEKNTVCNI